ncbi:MAG: hypothetical protein PWR06_1608 [Thermoanaerobacteraceae bacterium]|nr:hypothetical protein [Thermoanaerobacteraceae bacterium]MDN5312278.1 hypothetical protein [Thermoanaerobacteraceae bacterium]
MKNKLEMTEWLIRNIHALILKGIDDKNAGRTAGPPGCFSTWNLKLICENELEMMDFLLDIIK